MNDDVAITPVETPTEAPQTPVTHYVPQGKHWTQTEVSDWALYFRPDIRMYSNRGMCGYRIVDQNSELFGHFIQCGTKWDDVAKRLEIP